MTQSIAAHFDGKVIIPDEPVELPVGEELQIQVTIKGKQRATKTGKKRRIIGLGQFHSGVSDLGSNKKHLENFGK
jgi:hypothetical protein